MRKRFRARSTMAGRRVAKGRGVAAGKGVVPSTGVAAGIYDHAGWAVVVCVAGDAVVDRRRIELIEPGLPCLPHHGPGQRLPLDEAVALVERVRGSAGSRARNALDALPPGVRAIAIRKRPDLPPTTAEQITSYWAQTRADTVMYRDALADAAKRRGWSVYEYETKRVLADAAGVLEIDDISGRLDEIGKALGRPWTQDHRLATAAAIVAGHMTTTSG